MRCSGSSCPINGGPSRCPSIIAILERQLGDTRRRERVAARAARRPRPVDRDTRRRHPAIANLARSVRHRRFDQPLVDARPRRGPPRDGAPPRPPGAWRRRPEHDESVRALVACPEPLLLDRRSRQRARRSRSRPTSLLEVLTRRFYKIRELENVQADVVGLRRSCGPSTSIVATGSTSCSPSPRRDEVDDALAAITAVAVDLPADETVVVDLYVIDGVGSGDDVDALAAGIRGQLAGAELPARLTRVAVIACRTAPEVDVRVPDVPPRRYHR